MGKSYIRAGLLLILSTMLGYLTGTSRTEDFVTVIKTNNTYGARRCAGTLKGNETVWLICSNKTRILVVRKVSSAQQINCSSQGEPSDGKVVNNKSSPELFINCTGHMNRCEETIQLHADYRQNATYAEVVYMCVNGVICGQTSRCNVSECRTTPSARECDWITTTGTAITSAADSGANTDLPMAVKTHFTAVLPIAITSQSLTKSDLKQATTTFATPSFNDVISTLLIEIASENTTSQQVMDAAHICSTVNGVDICIVAGVSGGILVVVFIIVVVIIIILCVRRRRNIKDGPDSSSTIKARKQVTKNSAITKGERMTSDNYWEIDLENNSSTHSNEEINETLSPNARTAAKLATERSCHDKLHMSLQSAHDTRVQSEAQSSPLHTFRETQHLFKGSNEKDGRDLHSEKTIYFILEPEPMEREGKVCFLSRRKGGDPIQQNIDPENKVLAGDENTGDSNVISYSQIKLDQKSLPFSDNKMLKGKSPFKIAQCRETNGPITDGNYEVVDIDSEEHSSTVGNQMHSIENWPIQLPHDTCQMIGTSLSSVMTDREKILAVDNMVDGSGKSGDDDELFMVENLVYESSKSLGPVGSKSSPISTVIDRPKQTTSNKVHTKKKVDEDDNIMIENTIYESGYAVNLSSEGKMIDNCLYESSSTVSVNEVGEHPAKRAVNKDVDQKLLHRGREDVVKQPGQPRRAPAIVTTAEGSRGALNSYRRRSPLLEWSQEERTSQV